jgi:hypothetical protein
LEGKGLSIAIIKTSLDFIGAADFPLWAKEALTLNERRIRHTSLILKAIE